MGQGGGRQGLEEGRGAEPGDSASLLVLPGRSGVLFSRKHSLYGVSDTNEEQGWFQHII